MKTTTFLGAILLAVATLGLGGCADDSASSGDDSNAAVEDLSTHQQLSDAALQGKLSGILAGITFTSEADYEYKVIVGDAVTAQTRLSKSVLRDKLGAALLANTDDHRDIKRAGRRADRLNVNEAIAVGNAAEVPADPNADEYSHQHHDKQLMISLKTMRAELKNVVGSTFGANADGADDEFGTVVYADVGVSKTSGKLIAIITQVAYT